MAWAIDNSFKRFMVAEIVAMVVQSKGP